MGRQDGEIGEIVVRGDQVTPGYFETVQVPLVRGRLLDERDVGDGIAVAVVNQRLARAIIITEISCRLRFVDPASRIAYRR